jgi:hypothetical protein
MFEPGTTRMQNGISHVMNYKIVIVYPGKLGIQMHVIYKKEKKIKGASSGSQSNATKLQKNW